MNIPEDICASIKKLYQNHSQSAIAKMLGVSRYVVATYARENGLQHRNGLLSDLRVLSGKQSVMSDEGRKRLSELRKRQYKSERRKKTFGLQQETKFRVCLLSSKARGARAYLCYKRGYFFCDDEWLLYYDEQTKRTPNEQRYTEQYGFRFVDAS